MFIKKISHSISGTSMIIISNEPLMPQWMKYLPIGSCLICSLVKHFGDKNDLFTGDSLFTLFDEFPVTSNFTWGTECDASFSTGFGSGFGSGFTKVDKLQLVRLSLTGSFFDPSSSLDESMELEPSEPLSLELSSFSFGNEGLRN